MSYPCEVCGRPFSTPGNRSRHKKQMHSTSTDGRRLSVIGNRSSVMQHPFTCIVAGCTQSGKTVWVKSLLENAQTTISPAPQRIIWCYGQWQPSFFTKGSHHRNLSIIYIVQNIFHQGKEMRNISLKCSLYRVVQVTKR